MTSKQDPIVKAVIDAYEQRSQRGIAKYDTTLEGNPGGVQYWIQHAQEEAMDLSLYLEKLKRKVPQSPANMLYDFQIALLNKVEARLEQLEESHPVFVQNPSEASALDKVFYQNLPRRYDLWKDDGPSYYRKDAIDLGLSLIKEEHDEFVEAVTLGFSEDLVLKELCDLLYVIYRFAVVFKLPVEEAFRRVHENNMMKITNGTFNEAGKLTKAPDHPKVNLKDLTGEN